MTMYLMVNIWKG